MSTGKTHNITVRETTYNRDRDSRSIRIQCDIDGCVSGRIEGSPAWRIDILVNLLIEAHPLDKAVA